MGLGDLAQECVHNHGHRSWYIGIPILDSLRSWSEIALISTIFFLNPSGEHSWPITCSNCLSILVISTYLMTTGSKLTVVCNPLGVSWHDIIRP